MPAHRLDTYKTVKRHGIGAMALVALNYACGRVWQCLTLNVLADFENQPFSSVHLSRGTS
jgi:hypothetical protein